MTMTNSDILNREIEGRLAASYGALPVAEVMLMAAKLGRITTNLWTDNFGTDWLELEWADGSSVTLNMTEGE